MKICSVVIPTRNRPLLLLRAVRSVLMELPPNGEIIVVDDASVSLAANVLECLDDQRVKVVRNETALGGGGSPARNKGMKHSSGEIIFFLDDDDEILPGYINRILSLDEIKDADFGFSARNFLEKIGDHEIKLKTEDRGLKTGYIPNDVPFFRRTFPFSSGFWIKRYAYSRVGEMSEIMTTNSDTDYCCRLYQSGLRGWFSSEPGVNIFKNTSNIEDQLDNVTKRAKAAERAEAFRLIAKNNDEFLKKDASASDFIYSRWIKHAIRAGMDADAIEALKKISYPRQRLKLAFVYKVSRIFKMLGVNFK